MNLEDLLALRQRLFEKGNEIQKSKGHDYSGDKDVLFNFKVSEIIGLDSSEEGCLIRMIDKVMRLVNFQKTGIMKVKDETIEDTVIDLIGYACLYDGLVLEKKNKEIKS